MNHNEYVQKYWDTKCSRCGHTLREHGTDEGTTMACRAPEGVQCVCTGYVLPEQRSAQIYIRDVDGKENWLEYKPLYGIERAMGVDDSLPEDDSTVDFRCYDDDGNLTHTGRLHDDPECENQAAALRYAESDWGATVIKVLRDDGCWHQEIG